MPSLKIETNSSFAASKKTCYFCENPFTPDSQIGVVINNGQRIGFVCELCREKDQDELHQILVNKAHQYHQKMEEFNEKAALQYIPVSSF